MEPKTLQEAIIYFADPANCREYLVARRWPDGVICPKCGSQNVIFMEKYNRWNCREKHESPQFTLKTGTVMEDSPISLSKWLPVMWLLVNCKNGISSYEVHRAVGITQKSAWFMLHRIRMAMKDADYRTKLGTPGPGGTGAGEAHAAKDEWDHADKAIEADEAFFGGKVTNMHAWRVQKMREEYPDALAEGYEVRKDNKTPVLGMFDRKTRQVRAKVIPNVKRETLQNEILKNVKYGSAVYTDEAVTHNTLRQKFVHETVNHAETYVNGKVHTNSLENFWSVTKRSLTGTYIAIEPFHLDRYLDEMTFRFNAKSKSDAQRFNKVLGQVTGRRLTYESLTGKVGARPF